MAMPVEGRVCEEDTVCYRLFVNVPQERDVSEYLEEQRDIFLAFLGRFCINYIWQQETFNLRLHTASTSTYDNRVIHSPGRVFVDHTLLRTTATPAPPIE